MVDNEISKLDLKPYVKPVFEQLQKDIYIDKIIEDLDKSEAFANECVYGRLVDDLSIKQFVVTIPFERLTTLGTPIPIATTSLSKSASINK